MQQSRPWARLDEFIRQHANRTFHCSQPVSYTHLRSATLPYATTDAAALAALARRLLLDPRHIGPIRLLGVGFSGLSNIRQDSLFPDLESAVSDADDDGAPAQRDAVAPSSTDAIGWRVGDDVRHRELGHGWVQGAGHGVVTVRFETRRTGPGPARTFASDSEDISPANPIDSLAWTDYLTTLADAASEHPVDDLAQG